jgi:membrane protease YdiL (CAAX protease family)
MSPRSTTVRGRETPSADGYFARSQQPLEILFFLLPLIVLYELGLLWVLRSGNSVLDNKAHDAIRRVFEALGLDPTAMSLPALSLPGILLVIILLVWHVLTRRPWHVDLKAVATMFAESACLALPLVVLAQLIMQALSTPVPATALATANDSLHELPVIGRLAISIGAGLYEELIFRMVLIAVLHTLCVEVLRWSETVAVTVSIVISALAFAAYHPLHDPDGALNWARAAAYFAIGGYFGSVFAFRGFGIVVGTHAAYDIAVLMMPRG